MKKKIHNLFSFLLPVILSASCAQLDQGKIQKRTVASVLQDRDLSQPITSYIGSDLGKIQYSILSEENFRLLNGRGWVLMKGQDIKDSDLYKFLEKNGDGGFHRILQMKGKLPDARGKFLRMLNNGITEKDCISKGHHKDCYDTDERRMMGSYQKDTFEKHSHSIGATFTSKGGSGYGVYTQVDDSRTGETGYKETRPKNIAVNIFIKINDL